MLLLVLGCAVQALALLAVLHFLPKPGGAQSAAQADDTETEAEKQRAAEVEKAWFSGLSSIMNYDGTQAGKAAMKDE